MSAIILNLVDELKSVNIFIQSCEVSKYSTIWLSCVWLSLWFYSCMFILYFMYTILLSCLSCIVIIIVNITASAHWTVWRSCVCHTIISTHYQSGYVSLHLWRCYVWSCVDSLSCLTGESVYQYNDNMWWCLMIYWEINYSDLLSSDLIVIIKIYSYCSDNEWRDFDCNTIKGLSIIEYPLSL